MKIILGASIIVILLFILSFTISTLIFWGIGNLVIWVFKINYEWTLLHGLVCAIIYAVLKEIL